MRYLDVIVDLSADAIDRMFTYSDGGNAAIGPGWQVEVPFGPRTLEGFGVGVKERCELPESRVKPVRRAVRDYPVIQAEVLLFSLEFILINLVVDVLYAAINPAIRYK